MGWLKNREYGRKNEYLAYYDQTRGQGQMPMTYAQWLKQGKMKTVRTADIGRRLSNTGMSEKEIAKLRGIK